MQRASLQKKRPINHYTGRKRYARKAFWPVSRKANDAFSWSW